MGLLDNILSGMQSPGGRMGLGLLAAAGPTAQPRSFGQRAMGLLAQMDADKAAEEERKQRAQMQALQQQLLQAQLGERQEAAGDRQRVREQAATDERVLRNFFTPMDGPMPDGGSPLMPRIDPATAIQQGASLPGVQKLLELNEALKPPRPKTTTLKPGEAVFDESGKQLFGLPAEQKPEAMSPVAKLLRERNQLPPNDPARAIYDQAIAKETTRAPGVNVNVNTAKPLVNEVLGGLGKQIDAGFSEAKGAVQSINTAQTLRQAAQSGIVAGPGAKFGVFGLQVGQMLGINGKDANEVLGNTRIAIQSMAKAELEAAQMMKGQGQITEAERDIIRRAAAGEINNFTSPEIVILADAMEKTARFKIQAHQRNVQQLRTIPGAEVAVPFYQVEMPPATQSQAPASGGGWSARRLP